MRIRTALAALAVALCAASCPVAITAVAQQASDGGGLSSVAGVDTSDPGENEETYSYGKFEYVVRDGKVVITRCDRDAESAVVPEEIDGKPVAAIGDHGFIGCFHLTSVEIPDSVTVIGEGAFDNCHSLAWVEIPDSVTSIGAEAFYYCDSLASVEIPDSVTSIGEGAFRGCDSLDLVAIPDSVTSIGDFAFAYCDSLDLVVIPDSVTSIGDQAFCGCDSLDLVVIPDSVTSIGYGAFSACKSMTSVAIPDSVTSIGDFAFAYCDSLDLVVIPDSVTSIGDQAFCICDSLAVIYVDPDNERYASIGGVLYDKLDKVLMRYPSGNGGSSFSIPQGILSIGAGAFHGCDSLDLVVIPDSVTSIGDWAFDDSVGLVVTRGSFAAQWAEENGMSYAYSNPNDWLLS